MYENSEILNYSIKYFKNVRKIWPKTLYGLLSTCIQRYKGTKSSV